MSRYTTDTDAKASIRVALTEYADEYNIDAIFTAAYTWKIDRDDWGRELLTTGGFEQAVSDGDFWAIVAANRIEPSAPLCRWCDSSAIAVSRADGSPACARHAHPADISV